MEDCPKSTAPVRDTSPHFPIFPDFRETSYAQRYNLLCRKLMKEQLYTVACILASPRTAVATGEYAALSEMTGLRTFVTEFAGHIAAEASRT
ncbi:MAG: PaeR7I family type II restriction endonuclease [Azoarcus sp.]|nr:PaeR7I family type II restriction endonuclease [Azoarcus sp.]